MSLVIFLKVHNSTEHYHLTVGIIKSVNLPLNTKMLPSKGTLEENIRPHRIIFFYQLIKDIRSTLLRIMLMLFVNLGN